MIQRKRITIIGIIIVGGIIITGVLALNGYFGGGAKVPEDTFTRGLVAYWSFDEGTGNIAYDISGNGNNGTIYGAKWTKGKYGSALQFDGVDDYVDCGNVLNIDLPITMSVFCYIDSLDAPAFIFGSDDVSTYYGWMFYISTTGKVVLLYGDGGGAASNYRRAFLTGEGTVTTGTWYHIVGIIRGPTDMAVYVNGSEVSGTYSGSGGDMAHSSDPARIGARTASGDYFHGLIDEVRIYNRALSAEEIRYHYNRGRPIAHWRFDEGSGTTTYDSSGNEYHGILHE